MQLRKFHCVFPFDNSNNNGSIRIYREVSKVQLSSKLRSYPSAEIKKFFMRICKRHVVGVVGLEDEKQKDDSEWQRF